MCDLTLSELFKVTQGQRSRCISTDQDMLNILSKGTHRLRRWFTRYERFNFRYLEWPWKVIQGQRSLQILNPLYQVPISVLSNYGSISHRLGLLRLQLYVTEVTYVTSKGHTRAKVKVHFDRPGHAEHFCQWAPIGYGRWFTHYERF